MLGLTAEQIVNASAAVFEDVIAAGGSREQAFQAVTEAAATIGLSAADIQNAVQVAYGGAGLDPARAIVEATYGSAFVESVPQPPPPLTADQVLAVNIADLYRQQGAGGVVAAMFKQGVSISELARVATSAGAYVNPTDAAQIINSYRAIEQQSRAISAAGNVQAVQPDWDRRQWTVTTYTQGQFNIPMDGVSMPPPPPASVPGGFVLPPESQRILPPTAAQTLAAQAIYVYEHGGARELIATMFKRGITLADLNTAFNAAGIHPDTARVAPLLAAYRAIETQSLALSNAPNVQKAQLDPDAGVFIVVTNTGTYRISADGVSMLPVPLSPPTRPTAAQIVAGAEAVWNAAGGGTHPSNAWAAMIAFGAERGFTEAMIRDAFSSTGKGAAWTAARDAAAKEGFEIAFAPVPRFIPVPPPVALPIQQIPRSPVTDVPTVRPDVQPPPRLSRRVPLTAEQMVEATAAVFKTQRDPRGGVNAVRAQAVANGYTWDQVIDAYRTVGGTAWAAFKATLAAAGEPMPSESTMPAWLIPAAIAAVSYLK